jgi:hypothetical protein
VRPQRADIAVPDLPRDLEWLNASDPPQVDELVAHGPALVHFFDFAQLNSIRALPYLMAWHERYRDAGLSVLGVHSPRYPFTGQPAKLAAAVERLGIEHPVADDSRYRLWHDYGCKGWPSLFLWGSDGTLRWAHFGEGDYDGTEAAIREQLEAVGAAATFPPLLEPLRASDAPGARVVPPSEEVFPGGSFSAPWRADAARDALELEYAAGGAHAAVDGEGELAVSLDGGAERPIPIPAPGLYELAEHPRHERHRLRLEPSAEVAVYSIAFSAGVP